MPTALVSVILVNFNKKDLCLQALHSLCAQTYKTLEIIVVDNGSSDGSTDMIRHSFPSAVLLALEKNYYFCAALNKGIHASQGKYVLLLNNDVVLTPEYIEKLVSFLTEHGEYGAVTGKIIRFDGQTIDTTGMLFSYTLKPHERGYNKKNCSQFYQDGPVFGASLAAPLMQRSMLDAIANGDEFFDERFRHYYEDLDIYWRAYQKGWQSYYTAAAVAYHARGKTNKAQTVWTRYYFPQMTVEMQADYIKNRYLTFLKNTHGILERMKFIVCMLPYDIALWGYLLFFRPPLFRVLIKRWLTVYPEWKRVWKKEEQGSR